MDVGETSFGFAGRDGGEGQRGCGSGGRRGDTVEQDRFNREESRRLGAKNCDYTQGQEKAVGFVNISPGIVIDKRSASDVTMGVRSMTITDNNQQVVVGYESGYILIHDHQRGSSYENKIHNKEIRAILTLDTSHQKNLIIISGSFDKTVKITRYAGENNFKEILSCELDHPVTGLSIVDQNSDSYLLMVTGDVTHYTKHDGSVQFWKLDKKLIEQNETGSTTSEHCFEKIFEKDMNDGIRCLDAYRCENGITLTVGMKDNSVRFYNKEMPDSRNHLLFELSKPSDFFSKKLEGHTGWVNAIKLYGKKWIVSGAADKTIRIWSQETLKCAFVLGGHKSWVNSLLVSSDFQFVISGCWNGSISVWSTSTRQRLAVIDKHGMKNITALCLYKSDQTESHIDSVTFLTGSIDKTVRAWNTGFSQDLFYLEKKKELGALAVTGLSCNKKGDVAAFATGSEITIFNPILDNPCERKTCIDLGDNGEEKIADLRVNFDGTCIFTVTNTGTIHVIRNENNEWKKTATTQKHREDVGDDDVEVRCMALSDKYIVVGDRYQGGSSTSQSGSNLTPCIIVRLADNLKEVGRHAFMRKEKVSYLAFSKDNELLAIACGYKTIYVMCLPNLINIKVQQVHKGLVASLCYFNMQNMFVSGGDDNMIVVWSLCNREKQSFKVVGTCEDAHDANITALAVTDSDKYIISAGKDRLIKIWSISSTNDVATIDCIVCLSEHESAITRMCLSSNLGVIISGSQQDEVIRWPMTPLLCPQNFYGLPHLPTFTIPGIVQHDQRANSLSMVTLERALDEFPLTLLFPIQQTVNDSDDSCDQSNIKEPSITCTKTTPIGWAASKLQRYEALKVMVSAEVPLLPLQNSNMTSMLRGSFKGSSTISTRLILNAITKGARVMESNFERPCERSGCLVLNSLAPKFHTDLNPGQSHETSQDKKSNPFCEFTHDLYELIDKDSGIAAEFLRKLRLIRVDPTCEPEKSLLNVGDFYTSENFPELGEELKFSVKPFHQEWKDKKHDKKIYMVPIFDASRSLLKKLVTARDVRLFDNDIARCVVRYKWGKYARRSYIKHFIFYILGLILISSFVFIIPLGSKRIDQGINREFLVLSCLFAVFLICEMILAVQHAIQARKLYLQEVWNWLNIFNNLIGYALLISTWTGYQDARGILSVTVYLRWIGLLFYLQGIKYTSAIVRMILAVTYDIRYFLLILCISLFASWLSFYTLLRDQDNAVSTSFQNDGNGMFLTFTMLVFAEFELDELTGDYIVLLRIIFIISTVFIGVILLNLLIAIMMDAYARVSKNHEVEFIALRAKVIVEMDCFTSRAENFPKWICQVLPEHPEHVNPDDDWRGTLNDIKTTTAMQIDSLRKYLEKQNGQQQPTSSN
eukprot:gene971-4215_t